jgi:hypothetical protein
VNTRYLAIVNEFLLAGSATLVPIYFFGRFLIKNFFYNNKKSFNINANPLKKAPA